MKCFPFLCICLAWFPAWTDSYIWLSVSLYTSKTHFLAPAVHGCSSLEISWVFLPGNSLQFSQHVRQVSPASFWSPFSLISQLDCEAHMCTCNTTAPRIPAEAMYETSHIKEYFPDTWCPDGAAPFISILKIRFHGWNECSYGRSIQGGVGGYL